ncbi:MAG TPA: HPP family protein [Marinagarivorans sp.]
MTQTSTNSDPANTARRGKKGFTLVAGIRPFTQLPMHLRSTGIQGAATIAERWVATIGGCLAIFCIAALSIRITGTLGAAAVVPSMGASAVLLFAVPHGPLSQPWALFVGHGVSAIVGVTCALLVPHMLLAASLAVGLAIGAMLLTRSIHPPGGATALAAVIGGPTIHELGYGYAVMPTLVNCVIIFAFAVVFNNLFPWRRYPVARVKYRPVPPNPAAPLDADSLQDALREHNIHMPVAQLLPAVHLALQKSKQRAGSIPIELGGVYSNDKPGAEWAVRKIVDESPHDDPEKHIVIYTVLEGYGAKRRSGSCRRYEFSAWAKKRLQAVPKQ